MSKRHTVTLDYIITALKDMFDHMDGVMQALAKKETQLKEDIYLAVKVANQKLPKHYAEVSPTTGLLLISANIIDPCRKSRSYTMWDKAMAIHPEDETSYTTQYQEACLQDEENEYCPKHRRMSIIEPKKVPPTIQFPSAKLRDLVNHLLIHMICPAMMNNTELLQEWLKGHPDNAIKQHAC